jgi:hypothetical protein
MRLCAEQSANIRVTRRRSDLVSPPPASSTGDRGVDNGRSISAAFSARSDKGHSVKQAEERGKTPRT